MTFKRVRIIIKLTGPTHSTWSTVYDTHTHIACTWITTIQSNSSSGALQQGWFTQTNKTKVWRLPHVGACTVLLVSGLQKRSRMETGVGAGRGLCSLGPGEEPEENMVDAIADLQCNPENTDHCLYGYTTLSTRQFLLSLSACGVVSKCPFTLLMNATEAWPHGADMKHEQLCLTHQKHLQMSTDSCVAHWLETGGTSITSPVCIKFHCVPPSWPRDSDCLSRHLHSLKWSLPASQAYYLNTHIAVLIHYFLFTNINSSE